MSRPPGILSTKATGHGPIYDLRQRHRLTQPQLAARIGCSPSQVARWERDGTGPQGYLHTIQLAKLAKEASAT